MLCLSAAALVGCSAADEPDRVVTPPTDCRDLAGNVVDCNLELPVEGGFRLTLDDTSCDASSNEVRVVEPVTETLLTNACSATLGQQWSFGLAPDEPYDAGTSLGLEIESDQVGTFPQGLRVTGDFPLWVAAFEDGFDTDFNDIVIIVEGIAAD
jgi:hypothetical protein